MPPGASWDVRCSRFNRRMNWIGSHVSGRHRSVAHHRPLHDRDLRRRSRRKHDHCYRRSGFSSERQRPLFTDAFVAVGALTGFIRALVDRAAPPGYARDPRRATISASNGRVLFLSIHYVLRQRQRSGYCSPRTTINWSVQTQIKHRSLEDPLINLRVANRSLTPINF
jgi:hypothetical protein